jgi:hypothetical protein
MFVRVVLLRLGAGWVQAQGLSGARIMVADMTSNGNDRPYQRYQTQYEYRIQNSHGSQT